MHLRRLRGRSLQIFRHVKFRSAVLPPNSPAPIPETCRELKGCCG
ncbi:MAG: hypothetical protein ACLS63_06130 [Flavonifractor plautii]